MPRGRSAARRRTHWSEGSGAEAARGATGSIILFSLPSGHEGETVVRVRGLLALVLTTATGVGDGYFGAFGMAIVTTAAATAGVGSIPTPLTEAGWDGWLLHRYFDVAKSVGDGGPGEYARLELDSKAMRKVNEDESIVGVAEYAENGTAVIDTQVRCRILSMFG